MFVHKYNIKNVFATFTLTLFFTCENSNCKHKCTVLPKRLHFYNKEKILLNTCICHLLQGDVKDVDLMT